MATDCLHKRRLELKKPIFISNEFREHINIPCGNCNRCLERRKMEWGFRMEIESRDSKTAYFVTLTYAPETVPYNQYGQKTLISRRVKIDKLEGESKKDFRARCKNIPDYSLQGFFKRLRQNEKRSKTTREHYFNRLDKKKDRIKYYACGEYGEEFGRPHYHAIIFNASEVNIVKSWKHGSVHVVKATKETIMYCMKYLDKWLGKKQDWRKAREFNIMSKGIGESYINKNLKWHKQNLDILFVTSREGFRIPMPKYYREAIFEEWERYLQVSIVENKIQELRDEAIKKEGIDIYNRKEVANDIYGRLKFENNTRKRVID